MISYLLKKAYFNLITILRGIFIKRYKSFSYIPSSCTVGDNVYIKPGCIFRNANLSIGEGTFINDRSVIDASAISIGKFCSISHDVKIGLGNHPKSFVTTSPFLYAKVRGFNDHDFDIKNKPCVLEHDVLVSANAVVLSGVNLGTGCIVAAGAIVIKDVPAYAIVAGVPAKIISYRFDEATRKALLKSEWWNLSNDKLKQVSHLIDNPDEFLKSLK